MANLLMSAVFLLCLHNSVCQEEYTHYWSVSESDKGRCPNGALGDLCQDILTAVKELDMGECKPANVTGLEVKDISVVSRESGTLTLRCPEDNSAVKYEWFTPCDDTQRCDTTRPVCTFQPEPSDEGQNVTCFSLNNIANRLYAGYYQLSKSCKQPASKAGLVVAAMTLVFIVCTI